MERFWGRRKDPKDILNKILGGRKGPKDILERFGLTERSKRYPKKIWADGKIQKIS